MINEDFVSKYRLDAIRALDDYVHAGGNAAAIVDSIIRAAIEEMHGRELYDVLQKTNKPVDEPVDGDETPKMSSVTLSLASRVAATEWLIKRYPQLQTIEAREIVVQAEKFLQLFAGMLEKVLGRVVQATIEIGPFQDIMSASEGLEILKQESER